MDVENPLGEVARRAGVSLEGLVRAQEQSPVALDRLRTACAALSLPEGCSVVVEGSLGRLEMTSGSDVDFVLLVPNEDGRIECGRVGTELERIVEDAGFRLPSSGGPFGATVNLSQVTQNIGGDADTNTMVTHRMLLLLESRPVVGDVAWHDSFKEVLETYLRKMTLKSRRPPRFLLNDLVRYWRTLCVDYEGKLREQAGQRWAIRNAKLRTVRKMLFAGGLFPLMACSELSADEIPEFLSQRLRLPPADRVALAALALDEMRAGGEALSAYSTFLERLDDPDWRERLESLVYDDRGSSAELREVKDLGRAFQEALGRLLFETRLAPLAQQYLIF